MQNDKLKIFLFFAIIVFGFAGYMWVNLEVVKCGYEHQDIGSIRKKLLEKNKKLRVQYANLFSPARIEKYAMDKLGLIKPAEKQFRYLKR